MQDIWARIEVWLKVNAAELFDSLRPGAMEEEIRETEHFLGVSFPEDLKTFYRLHDGQWAWYDRPERYQSNRPPDFGLYGMHQFLSLARVQDEWSVWVDVWNENKWVTLENGETIRSWSEKWIPLTSDGCGDAYLIDLSAVLMGGNVGQIIEYQKCIEEEIVAPSFRAWLETFANDLEAGHYIYDILPGWLCDLRLGIDEYLVE